MNWLLQQPLVIIVAGLVVELLLFLALQQTGKKSVAVAMVVVAVLLVGGVALERFVVTPEEAIRTTLYQIAADAQRNDVDAVVAHISRRSPETETLARRRMGPVTFKEVSVKQISDLTVHNPSQSASARVRIKAVGSAGFIDNQVVLREFDVDFVLEDGAWKVRGFEDLGNPLRQTR